jgi:hypothetical protein
MWIVLCAVTLLLNLVVSIKLLERLKTSHTKVWESMGSPKYGDSNISEQWGKLASFVWSRKFLELGDLRLSRLSWLAMIGEVAAVGTFVLSIVLT